MSTLNAHIGEIKLAKRGETLKALLGSCLGIAIFWREQKKCALAHCLLPENPHKSFEINGRFVDQAIVSMLSLLKAKPSDYTKLEVVIVGGSNLTSKHEEFEHQVGSKNVKAALKTCQRLNLPIIFQDVGGEHGRKIKIESSDFSFEVSQIPRTSEAA